MKNKEKYPSWINMFESVSKKSKSKIFEDEIVWNINIDLGVEFIGNTASASYTKWLHKDNKIGMVEYFPKSDKIHIHSKGVDGWIDNGLRWIYDNYSLQS